MPLLKHPVLVLACWFVSHLPASAQVEPSFQAYLQLGQRYEKQGDVQKALSFYRQAQSYAGPADRQSLTQTINRLDELVQQQSLLNQSQADDVQRKINALANPQNRRRLQEDLTALQQQNSATPADYQRLARRVEAAGEVEKEIVTTTGTDSPSPRRLTPVRHPAAPNTTRPAGPPPKSITVGMPSTAVKGKTESNATKSAGTLPVLRKEN